MSEPTYREALSESWKLSWRHKGLWAFGLFAMLLGQMGIAEFFVKMGVVSNTLRASNFWEAIKLLFSAKFWRMIFNSLSPGLDSWVWFIWLALVLAAFAFVLLFVAVVCRGAIIHASAKYAKRGMALPCERKAWHSGVAHFWKLLALEIIRKLSLLLIGSMIVWISFSSSSFDSYFGGLAYTALFAIALLASMVLSFLTIYAAGYVVVEEENLLSSAKLAWKLFVKHWLVSFEVGIIILLANIALLFAMLAAVVYLFFLPMLIGDYIAIWTGAVSIFKGGVLAGYALFIVFAVLANAVFTVFTISSWTYLFTKMHSHGVTSKILRLMGKSRA